MSMIPWKQRLAQAGDTGRREPELRWLKNITLSGYLEGAAVTLGNPYPLWLLRRMSPYLAPDLRMFEVARRLREDCADPGGNPWAGAVIFRLFCEIPYLIGNKEKGDALS